MKSNMKSRMNSQMKKLFAALITVSVVVSLLSGCGGSNGSGGSGGSAGDQQAPAQTASQGAGGSYTAHVFKVPEGYEVTGEEIALSADNRTAVFAIRKAGAAKESGAMTESVQS